MFVLLRLVVLVLLLLAVLVLLLLPVVLLILFLLDPIRLSRKVVIYPCFHPRLSQRVVIYLCFHPRLSRRVVFLVAVVVFFFLFETSPGGFELVVVDAVHR